MAEYNARIKHKRDTDVNWADADPVLLNGEIIVVDTMDGHVRKKVGDGIQRYSHLPFDDEQLAGVVQSLTNAQKEQARTNIGAGQPVFAVNLTEVEIDNYTADKTAAEIEAAYQVGRTIVCRMNGPFTGTYIPVELPLLSRLQERVFYFGAEQLSSQSSGKRLDRLSVQISDSGVNVSADVARIYEKSDYGIPKSDLADDVQTSLAKADTSISYDSQTLTDAQKQQARQNIGAVDENLGCNKYNIHVTTTSGTTKDFTYYTNEGEIRQPTEAVDSSIRTAFLGLTLWPSAKGISENLAKTLSKQYKILYDANYIDSPCCIIKSPLESGDKVLLSYHSSDNTVHVSGGWTDGYYNIIYDVANDVLTYFYVDNNISAVNGAVNQLVMSANPTEDMHIATKQYVDTAKTEAQQLGLTTATPGQIIKVKTVQDGKPTEWEAVDDRLPKVSPSDAGNVLGVEQIGEFEYGYALTHMPTLSDLIPLGITNASPGQFAKVSFVDDFGGPTAWEAADIYEKPTSGIPKSDLEQSVQTSLDLADTALQAVPDTYRTAAAQDELDTAKQPKAITDVGGYFGENPTVESALQQIGGALILRTWTD